MLSQILEEISLNDWHEDTLIARVAFTNPFFFCPFEPVFGDFKGVNRFFFVHSEASADIKLHLNVGIELGLNVNDPLRGEHVAASVYV